MGMAHACFMHELSDNGKMIQITRSVRVSESIAMLAIDTVLINDTQSLLACMWPAHPHPMQYTAATTKEYNQGNHTMQQLAADELCAGVVSAKPSE